MHGLQGLITWKSEVPQPLRGLCVHEPHWPASPDGPRAVPLLLGPRAPSLPLVCHVRLPPAMLVGSTGRLPLLNSLPFAFCSSADI